MKMNSPALHPFTCVVWTHSISSQAGKTGIKLFPAPWELFFPLSKPFKEIYSAPAVLHVQNSPSTDNKQHFQLLQGIKCSLLVPSTESVTLGAPEEPPSISKGILGGSGGLFTHPNTKGQSK